MKPFKIWCETEKEKRAVLKKMERMGIYWASGHKPTEVNNLTKCSAPIDLYVNERKELRAGFGNRSSFKGQRYHYKSVCEFLNEQEKIIIYRDGRKVIALDKRTGKKAEARCNPSDTFDFSIGARIAFDRLIPNKEAAATEPKAFTGKAVYLGGHETNDLCFTVGRIYEFTDGKVRDNDGDLRPCYCDMSQQFGVTHDLRSWNFLPIVE